METPNTSSSYFRRFGYCQRQIAAPPPANLGLSVVIPCLNEPDLIGTLDSLWNCASPIGNAEVIVVINSPTNCAPEIRDQNEATLRQASQWADKHHHPKVFFHFLLFPDLPVRQAGVGLARKIGMDEATRRFDDLGRSETGVIACMDADCRCDPNYLAAVEAHFRDHPNTPGCSIYFEHPLAGGSLPGVAEAITLYELHLRYYVQALRDSGFPYAHHTVGSSMAVRAAAYKSQGGMNRRQAGEDFYFLQKIMPLGGYTDLTQTRVLPSARASDRVPFGTGRAVREWLASQTLTSYALESFADLKVLFAGVDELSELRTFAGSNFEARLSRPLKQFLAQQHFSDAFGEIRANTSSRASFQKRFFGWFNGFRVMKFMHYAQESFYGGRAVDGEAVKLLALRNGAAPRESERSPSELLFEFRRLDRQSMAFNRS